ncbi:pilus assembly protein N-terminal domain-containing protein [Microvirga makkahensis]|uniref:Pilus formation protein N-terminal domain-containing protein n=1 Tax=Microvirga makkahensis TaxID=1128670 RepID=A0A7X3MPA8_9HYPH|nr:pilus assembly protein N-terminal domain-containing protein [Microvirga makkahensis]MXQ10687.1 hypothetical protein [Microvirga makkahensis]
MRKPGRAISTIAVFVGMCVADAPSHADEPKLSPMPNPSASAQVGLQVGQAIQVVIDFAKILTLERTAKTIVIGNSGILDATVNDERTVVLTGKAAGTTNMIVLGEDNKEILNTSVIVTPGRQVTTVYQGLQRQTYSCFSACTPVLSVGDEAGHFDRARAQIQSRQEFATGNGAAQ